MHLLNMFLKNQGLATYKTALELCCQYNMRLLTIDSKEKLDCMAQAKPRKLKTLHTSHFAVIGTIFYFENE